MALSLKVVQILNVPLSPLESQSWKIIKPSLEIAGKMEGIGQLEVVVLGVDDEKIRELNYNFRQIDHATDVLSFPQWQTEEIPLLDYGMPLGDIVVSITKTREQSLQYGHTFERELIFLVVHGFLHLLGYDHKQVDDAQKMEKRQNQILAAIGINR